MPSLSTYGIWIPKQGWLKEGGKPIAFEDIQVAEETARIVGQRARVRFIDKSLANLEDTILRVEEARRWNPWRTLKSLLLRHK
jgi:hypothetical protein